MDLTSSGVTIDFLGFFFSGWIKSSSSSVDLFSFIAVFSPLYSRFVLLSSDRR